MDSQEPQENLGLVLSEGEVDQAGDTSKKWREHCFQNGKWEEAGPKCYFTIVPGIPLYIYWPGSKCLLYAMLKKGQFYYLIFQNRKEAKSRHHRKYLCFWHSHFHIQDQRYQQASWVLVKKSPVIHNTPLQSKVCLSPPSVTTWSSAPWGPLSNGPLSRNWVF